MYSIENNDILTITNPGSVNKLYKLSFIKKYKIRFPNKKRAEDLNFTYLSLILANGIVGIEKYYYHYRIHEESITHLLAYNPLEFCSVFIMLKRKIIKLNYQNILKNSFNLTFDIICKNELERLHNNMSKEEYSLMIKELNVNIKAGVYL